MLILADSGILLRLFEPKEPDHALIQSSVQILGYGLSVAETELRLQDLEQGFSLLFEPHATYSIWRDLVVSLSVKGKQVHDGRLAALMKANGIAHILTLNGSDFVRYPGITVIHPADVTTTP
jgi:predicted nucleic acid-binding protein